MNSKRKCIIITGRQRSGKTTLARKLGESLWMPVIIRDEIKEGYVTTFGVKHDELPPDTNRLVTDFFFEMVDRYLAGNISIVIEGRSSIRFGNPGSRRSSSGRKYGWSYVRLKKRRPRDARFSEPWIIRTECFITAITARLITGKPVRIYRPLVMKFRSSISPRSMSRQMKHTSRASTR